MRFVLLTLGLTLSAMAMGCSPKIGDHCATSVNCDINGTRICDVAQPNGYCTVSNCDPGSCPVAESDCVQFEPAVERLSVTYCMKKCTKDGDCRTGDGYRCLAATDVAAVNLDNGNKVCVIPRPTSSTTTTPDAGN